MRKLPIVGFALLGLGITGCPALIVGSIVGSLGYAGYQYTRTDAAPKPASQPQPTAKATPSLNDIE
jgi:hypothetical protein